MSYISHDKMESIPLHRVAVLRPFTQFLADVGAPVELGFQQTGLPLCALEDVNNYVPSHRFWAFLVNMAQSQGIEDLGFRVGCTFGADCADPHLTALLRRSPTLFHGLLKASKLINKTVSNCRVGVLQPLCSQHSYLFFSPSCDAHNPAIEQIGWFGLTTLLGMVRTYTGPRWQPTEIGVMTNHTPCRYIREQLPATHIQLSQPYTYVALEDTLLSLPPFPHAAATTAFSLPHYDPLSNDFVGSLKQLLRSYIQEPDLSIEFTAALSDASKRNLQRKLTELGTCYSEVLDQVRFHEASRLLQDPGMKVADVSHRMGYSDPTHFSRAFRRIAGVNPQVYRRQYRH